MLRIKATGHLVTRVEEITEAAKNKGHKIGLVVSSSRPSGRYHGLDQGMVFPMEYYRLYEQEQNEELAPGDYVSTKGGQEVIVVDREAIDTLGFSPTAKINGMIPICVLTGPNAGNMGWMAETALEEVK